MVHLLRASTSGGESECDNGSASLQFSLGNDIKNIHNLCGFISAVNKDGTYDVTYKNNQWDRNVAPKLLRAAKSECKPSRRKRNQTWTMVPVVDTSWKDTSIINDNNVVQGKRKRPGGSVYLSKP